MLMCACAAMAVFLPSGVLPPWSPRRMEALSFDAHFMVQDRLPASPFWIVALIATAVLLSAGRLALLQISEGERAIDRFVAAIVDEDGGDDDF